MTSRQNKARSKKKTTADAAVFVVMRRAKQCRPHAVCRRAIVTRASRSKARLRLVTNRRDSWRSHVHSTRFGKRCSSSSCKLAMCGGEGEDPSSFLSGVAKGDTLFREREYPPFTHFRTVRKYSAPARNNLQMVLLNRFQNLARDINTTRRCVRQRMRNTAAVADDVEPLVRRFKVLVERDLHVVELDLHAVE